MKQIPFKALIDAGSIREVDVIGQGREWMIRFRIGMNDHVLHTARGDVRTFAGLQACVSYLRDLGIGHVRVDMTNWNPKQEGF